MHTDTEATEQTEHTERGGPETGAADADRAKQKQRQSARLDLGAKSAGGVLVLGVVALNAALAVQTSRGWLQDNWPWVVLAAVVLLAVVFLAPSVRHYFQKRSPALRAAVFLLVVVPVVVLGVASVFFWLPTAGQLIALRSVILVVLVVTPALMWWLFLATQRASLLNEFLANLHRLGMFEPRSTGSHAETEVARLTRVSSYLQRFEATYGRLPKEIHHDVLTGRFHPYRGKESRDQAPLATAAVPVSLAVVVLSVGWLIALPPIDSFPLDDVTSPRWLLALSPNPTPTTFAFLGAYFFSMQMLFRRYVRGDLRGSAYVAMVLRIVLAVIGIWVLSAVNAERAWMDRSSMLLLAFVVGVFPMVAWQVIRSLATKAFHITLQSLESRLPLERLDGLTVWHEARLEEEDIENVPNMATADLVDLLVNTRIPATRIIDWIDQAILLTQLGPDEAGNGNERSSRRRLAKHGIRTASDLLRTVADKAPGEEMEAFERVLVDADGVPAVASIVSALKTNSNLVRVLRWRGLEGLIATPAGHPRPQLNGHKPASVATTYSG